MHDLVDVKRNEVDYFIDIICDGDEHIMISVFDDFYSHVNNILSQNDLTWNSKLHTIKGGLDIIGFVTLSEQLNSFSTHNAHHQSKNIILKSLKKYKKKIKDRSKEIKILNNIHLN